MRALILILKLVALQAPAQVPGLHAVERHPPAAVRPGLEREAALERPDLPRAAPALAPRRASPEILAVLLESPC